MGYVHTHRGTKPSSATVEGLLPQHLLCVPLLRRLLWHSCEHRPPTEPARQQLELPHPCLTAEASFNTIASRS